MVRLVRQVTASPGTAGYTQRNAIVRFNVVSSADGLNVHSEYWH